MIFTRRSPRLHLEVTIPEAEERHLFPRLQYIISFIFKPNPLFHITQAGRCRNGSTSIETARLSLRAPLDPTCFSIYTRSAHQTYASNNVTAMLAELWQIATIPSFKYSQNISLIIPFTSHFNHACCYPRREVTIREGYLEPFPSQQPRYRWLCPLFLCSQEQATTKRQPENKRWKMHS